MQKLLNDHGIGEALTPSRKKEVSPVKLLLQIFKDLSAIAINPNATVNDSI